MVGTCRWDDRWHSEDVVDMRRYLLVLDTDLLSLDDQLDQEPINYLVKQQEQEQSEVVVLSLAGQTKLPSLELVLGGATSGIFAPAKSPIRPQSDHDLRWTRRPAAMITTKSS